MTSVRKPSNETGRAGSHREDGTRAKVSGETYLSASLDIGPAAKVSDGTRYSSAQSQKEHFLIRWIAAAKGKREEFVRSQPIRTPLQVTERDPDYKGEQIKRRCTDEYGIYFLGGVVLLWIGAISYCISYSDIGRIKNGYDSCGNVCGRTPDCAKMQISRMPFGIECNQSCALITKDQKLVEFQKADSIVYNSDEINRTCVAKCSPGFIQILSKCIPFQGTELGNTIFFLVGYEKIAQEIAEDICAAWPYVSFVVLISAGSCLLVLPALRFYSRYSIWVVLISTSVCSVVTSVYCWNRFIDASSLGKVDEHGRDQKYTYLFTSIGSTIASINTVILTVAVKSKIKWVSELFVQCAKAKISLPRLILMPIMTFVLVSCLFAIGSYLAVVIESSGHLHYGGKTVTYEKDVFMLFSKWYNCVVILLLIFFVMGIQDYVVASSVVYLFFTRGQKRLGYPVFRSLRNVFRYHIGSIAMFSAITKINAAIAGVLSRFKFKLSIAAPGTIARVFGCCCACLYKEVCKFVVGLSERSYVTMSMFGMSFLESGREAYLITFDNRSSLRQVVAAGRHLILFVKVLVVMIGFLTGHSFYLQLERVQHFGFLVFFTMALSFFICNCFVSVFEMTLSAILICYCIDCQLNDGAEKPYFMSPDLEAFVKKASADPNLQEVAVDNKSNDYLSASSR